jgi:hypothetical protein
MAYMSSSELLAFQLGRDGSGKMFLTSGETIEVPLGDEPLAPTSSIVTSTVIVPWARLVLTMDRGDEITVQLPLPSDVAPLGGRPSIYLDQNHWSTLTNVIHQPGRVAHSDEHAAALRLIDLARDQAVVLPMSAAHMAETAKQRDREERYDRARTIVELSAGWQMRDPLEVRRAELVEAFQRRYGGQEAERPAVITLEPCAFSAGRLSEFLVPADDLEIDAETQWTLRVLTRVSACLDALFDAEHVPTVPVPGWAEGFQEFASFLAQNPTGREMKRKRTHVRFISDLGSELAEAAFAAGITPDEMGEWAIRDSESDLSSMPALGLYREVIHEKLCDTQLRWEENDLADMMYLTAATGYCDYVVGERTHASYIASCLRRLGRPVQICPNLRSLIAEL